MNISFIGFGNMAQAIAHGLISNKSITISASAPSLTVGKTACGIITNPNNIAVTTTANVIIFAAKPAKMEGIIKEIIQEIPNNCLIISVVSGLTLSWFEKRTNPNTAIIRTMPNIAASIGQSATPLIANNSVNETQREICTNIFKSIGMCEWIKDESQIDSFTALSGSGPAYVFLFIESMVKAGVKLGIGENQAIKFATQTVRGALELAEHSNISLEELRKKVTAPAGTTAAALKVLSDGMFEDLINNAMHAANARAKELGGGK